MLRLAAPTLLALIPMALTACSATMNEQITRSIGVLQEVQASERAVDSTVLSKAHGVAIVHETQWALAVGGATGSGVLVRRLTDGTWSPPCAISTSALSVGLSIGGEARSVVFVFDKDETLDQLVGDGSFFLANAQGTFGESHGHTDEPAQSTGNVHAYIVASGLFASAALGNMTIEVDDEMNRTAYGAQFTAWDILDGHVTAPPESRALASRLSRIAGDRQASTTLPTPPNATVVSTPVETAEADEPAAAPRRPVVAR